MITSLGNEVSQILILEDFYEEKNMLVSKTVLPQQCTTAITLLIIRDNMVNIKVVSLKNASKFFTALKFYH